HRIGCAGYLSRPPRPAGRGWRWGMAGREVNEPASSAYQRALRRLARRDHSEHELRRALLQRGHPPGEVEGALQRLRAERYLDDAGFAARFARSRMAARGQGRLRVRQGLHERGVAPALAEGGIKEALTEVSEKAVLDALARRHWRQRAG